ncbi:hypothetical protein [Sandaracinus amylolyticus]|uniref:hypothetical protein n=1 Tax=Sandaracinus amylolyticus TaxID=927083 RepID=UPI001F2BBF73|nr:hypothetical protein [Sandaracinus amylolyticus]UJR81267.1 Hypothetical protein I5071_33230 [Sandaracinus amylolyticus]
MPLIELVWDPDCPNVEGAREALRAALGRVGAPLEWREWRRDDPEAPEHARRAGSPAILIDGRDVEGHETTGAACCRIYVGPDGRRAGAPSVDAIVAALERTRA